MQARRLRRSVPADARSMSVQWNRAPFAEGRAGRESDARLSGRRGGSASCGVVSPPIAGRGRSISQARRISGARIGESVSQRIVGFPRRVMPEGDESRLVQCRHCAALDELRHAGRGILMRFSICWPSAGGPASRRASRSSPSSSTWCWRTARGRTAPSRRGNEARDRLEKIQPAVYFVGDDSGCAGAMSRIACNSSSRSSPSDLPAC